jgi:3-phytase
MATGLTPVVRTEPVNDDADDPAIWVCASDPAKSLILGTNKAAAPTGALVVFGLDGKIRQVVDGVDRPNNVDVEYGLRLGGALVDVAVVTERYRSRLRVFRIPSDGGLLTEVSSEAGVAVFAGEKAEWAQPMGIALYRRPRDGAVFALVSRKESGPTGRLWQYHLEDDGHGRVAAVKVRELGNIAPGSEVEAVAVDDALGYAYFAEERAGIHKWHADPDHVDAGTPLAAFAREGFKGDREGIAVYGGDDGSGYLLCTDQIVGGSRYHLYPRRGPSEAPHEHRLLRVIEGGADETDGLEASAAALSPAFPRGLVVAMNSTGRNFFYYRPEDLRLPVDAPTSIARHEKATSSR